MLKKIVTTVGLVSVFGASAAFAVQNLTTTATALTPIKYATESLGTRNTTTGTGTNVGTTFFDVVGSGTALDVVATTGFTGTKTGVADYYVRVDLTNAAYSVGAGTMTIRNRGNTPFNEGIDATSILFSGGLVGSSSAIYKMDISNPMTVTATIVNKFTQIGTNGNPTVKMSIFETLTEANKGDTGANISTSSKETIKVQAGGKATTVAAVETAAVSTGFLKYVKVAATGTTNLLAELGATTFSTTTNTLDALDGSAIAAADLYTASTSAVTVTGDLSLGTWYFDAAGCAGAAAPPTTKKLKLNAAKTSGTSTVTILTSNSTLCNVVDGKTAIPVSSYALGINYTPFTGTAGATDFTGVSLGSVARNGTSDNINYLTTFSSYNQRVYITNRALVDSTYAFTFQTEDGVTATAGTAATGTSKAGTVLALKAADIVTLTGKTRTAATLAIVGTPSLFSVSTQQVNLANGATDTIVYRQ